MNKIPSQQLPDDKLSCFLTKHFGNQVSFNNGCWLYLNNDDGYIWGTNPYGLDWACNYDEHWEDKVISWLNHWDPARTETGELITTD